MRFRHGLSLLFPALVFLLSCFFLFKDLSDFPLWQDEANAALLGKNILTFGVPQVFDGENYIAYHPSDVRHDHVWRLWGWIPLYINAAAYWLAGANTLVARLPYSAIGVLFFLFFHRSLKKRHGSSHIPEIAVVLSLFCIPLLLHFRQCQYYGPTILLTWIIFLLAEEDLSEKKNFWGLILASFVLFNCNFLAWAVALSNCSVIQVVRLIREKRLGWNRVSGLFWAGLVNLPCLLLYRSWELWGQYAAGDPLSLLSLAESARVLFDYIVDPLMPSWFLLGLGILYLLFGRGSLEPATRRICWSSWFFFFAYASIVLVVSEGTYRYYIAAVPVFFYGVAILCEGLHRRSRAFTALLVSALLITNLLSFRQGPRGRFVSIFGKFWTEITSDQEDANEILIEYLSENARRGDTVLANYAGFPIIYYTGLTVVGGPSGYRIPDTPFPEKAPPVDRPDWLIFRKAWDYNSEEFREILAMGNYRRITLRGVDTKWGNRPNPYEHHFRTPRKGPPLEIFELVEER